MSEQHPKDKLREIAARLQAVFMAPTREASIVALREFDTRSLFDAAWLLKREQGLRARLQQTLKKCAQLEIQLQRTQAKHEKTGLRVPPIRKPSITEGELREISKELVLDGAMDDAFEVDEEEWYETQDS